MLLALHRIAVAHRWSSRRLIASVLSLCALGAQAQSKCSATGVMSGEKFAFNNCAVAVYDESVAIWFNEAPTSAQEAEDFQVTAFAAEKLDGKARTLLQIMFGPGGGAGTVSAATLKSIQLQANHAKSPFLGIQTVVESPKDFKVEKMIGEVKPRGSIAGKIVGSWNKTKWNLDFDVKLPAKEASAGVGCGQ